MKIFTIIRDAIKQSVDFLKNKIFNFGKCIASYIRQSRDFIKDYSGIICFYFFTGILILFPIWLYFIGVLKCQSHKDFLKNNLLQFGIIFSGVIVILLLFKLPSIHIKKSHHHQLNTFRNDNSHQLNTFKNAILYLFQNGRPAWILGLAVSNIIIALYFFIPSISSVDRFGTSFTVFIGIIAIFLGTHYLYEKEAPLIGTISLLKKLNKDLENFKSGNLYFVFPALNFGFYTEAIINEKNIFNLENNVWGFNRNNAPDSLAADLFFKLEKIAETRSNTRKAIIYNDKNRANYLKQLYMTYHYMISKKDECQDNIDNENFIKIKIKSYFNNIDVKKCVESAKLISSFFSVTQVKPNELIQPVIVIGDIVYVIADYGMPIFDETKKYFVPLKEEGQPVELICWRRNDASLAKQIVNHIERFIETY